MADQRLEGAVNTVKGTVNEGVGKLTGDKKLEAKGKVQKVQGKAQDALGDDIKGFNPTGLLVAVFGAIAVVFVARLMRRRDDHH
jgi:uncharacterized protein YjbJ (UPF0337 family)